MSDVENRLAILETQGINDKEALKRIEGNTAVIMKTMANLPCKVHEERVGWLRVSVYVLWGVVVLTGVIKGVFFMKGTT